MQGFNTVLNRSSGEYCEKHSRFLGFCLPCENEEQAAGYIKEFRAKYWDAKHCVYAYVLQQNNTARFSDDGEPHGTAAKPILEVINGANLKNVLVIVVRYFGGILLGTGGLVRAYTAAAKQAVLNAEICKMVPCTVFGTQCEYNIISTVTAVIENSGGTVLSTDYNENVAVEFYVETACVKEFLLTANEKLAGKTEFIAEGEKLLPVKKGN